jgi:hypothetical protein
MVDKTIAVIFVFLVGVFLALLGVVIIDGILRLVQNYG